QPRMAGQAALDHGELAHQNTGRETSDQCEQDLPKTSVDHYNRRWTAQMPEGQPGTQREHTSCSDLWRTFSSTTYPSSPPGSEAPIRPCQERSGDAPPSAAVRGLRSHGETRSPSHPEARRPHREGAKGETGLGQANGSSETEDAGAVPTLPHRAARRPAA